mmetsp:Transcript_69203/g.202645  ORF Transcript_69203/g.202645 Transcript_69203/m.202645 type:complete len:224 (+) Transcript_69203:73-744(+)
MALQAVRAASLLALLGPACGLRVEWAKGCSCLNWKEVYDSGLAKCGDGMELSLADNDFEKDKDMCRDLPGVPGSAFYANQDHEYCMAMEKTTGPKKMRQGSWCYVSGGCHDIGQGSRASDKLKWRPCTRQDRKIEQLAPSELFELAQKNNKSNMDFALMAYDWAEVRGFFPKPITLQQRLQQAALGLNRTVLTKPSSEHIMKWKDEIWEVHHSKAVCVEGCPI